MEINIYSELIWIVAILISSLVLVIFLGSDKLSSKIFAFSIFFTSIWVTGVGFLISINIYEYALYTVRINYFIGNIIAVSFFYFFTIFPDDKKANKIIITFLFIFEIFMTYLYVFTDLIITKVNKIDSIANWSWNFGKISIIFEITFIFSFVYGSILLYNKYNKDYKINDKINLKFMLFTIIVGSVLPTIFCIILPRFNYFDLNWIGPVSEIIWIPILAFSIIKYKQMHVSAFLAEILAIGMTIAFFINIFADVFINTIFRLVIFIIFITLAIYLIIITIRDAKHKNQLSSLNLHLAEKVEEQTIEVKKAYEVEKKARRDLEKLNETKDQFIMMTQHNLRTPVTSIKNELGTLISEEIILNNKKILNSFNNINISAKHLTDIVDDFLNITTLKVGSQILKKELGNLKIIIENIFQELRIDIENMNLIVEYPKEDSSWPLINMDLNKMREVFLILIENAIKYNENNGSISIINRFDKNNIKIAIENTGVGITKEDKQNIFSRLFYRSKQAQIKNPIGMGIGLQVARAIVKGHNGDISINSIKQNTGTRVEMILPLKFNY